MSAKELEYLASIETTLKECKEALSVLEKIKRGSLKIKLQEKIWLQRNLVDILVVRLYTFIDPDNNSISLVNLPKHLNFLSTDPYHADLKKILKTYNSFFKKIKSNRNARIAHIKKKIYLGFTRSTLKKFPALQALSSLPPVLYKKEYLLSFNLPYTKIKNLLSKIEKLIEKLVVESFIYP